MLTAEQVDTALDFDSMAKAGSMLGSGGVIVIDDRCCMVQLGLRVAQFYSTSRAGSARRAARGRAGWCRSSNGSRTGDAEQA